MHDGDRDKFKFLMAGLAEIFNSALTEEKLSIFWLVLEDRTIEEVSLGVERLLKTRTVASFPKPAEIIQAIDGSSDDRSLQALIRVEGAIQRHGYYASVDFQDSVIHRVIEIMGGWIVLSEKYANMAEWIFTRKEFERIFKSIEHKIHFIEAPAYLKGFFEESNRKSGCLNYIPQPIIIDGGNNIKLLTPLAEESWL